MVFALFLLAAVTVVLRLLGGVENSGGGSMVVLIALPLLLFALPTVAAVEDVNDPGFALAEGSVGFSRRIMLCGGIAGLWNEGDDCDGWEFVV